MNRQERRANKLIPVGGVLVERDALRIAEAIHDYDPNLRLEYLEQADNLSQPPFRVVEHCKDGLDRVVLTAWELNETVLHRIYAADTERQDIDARITKANEKARQDQEDKQREKLDEAADIAKYVLRSPKTRYTVRDGDKLIKFE